MSFEVSDILLKESIVKTLSGNVENILYMPQQTTSIVGNNTTHALYNKHLDSETTMFMDSNNNSKQFTFNLDLLPESLCHFMLPNVTVPNQILSNIAIQTMTNKTIDAELNTLLNIGDSAIDVGAGINVTKFGSGTVDNTEFGYLNGVTSPIQSQIDTHVTDISNPHSVSPVQVGNVIAQWNASEIQGIPVDPTAPSEGTTLIYDPTTSSYKAGHAFEDSQTAIVMDDFISASPSQIWVFQNEGVNSSALIVDGIGGQIKIESGDTLNNFSRIDTAFKIGQIGSTCNLKIRVKMNSAATYTKLNLGFVNDSNNLVDFQYDATSSVVNWFARTINGGTTTSADTSVVGDTNWHIFELRTSTSDVRFFIDSTLVVTNTTNLHGGLMKIYVTQSSNNNALHSINCDYIKLICDREGNVEGTGGGGGGGGCIIL